MIRNSRYNLFASECEKNTSPSLTIQGDSQSVYELFQRMVLGQNPQDLLKNQSHNLNQQEKMANIDREPFAGKVHIHFDSSEGPADFDSVDDSLNRIGFTPEEAFQLQHHYSEIGLREYESSQTPPEPQKPSSEPETPPQSTVV